MQEVLRELRMRDRAQPEFLQAVASVAASLQPVLERRPELLPVFERMCEPERQIMFRVAWLDDSNQIQVCSTGGGARLAVLRPALRSLINAHEHTVVWVQAVTWVCFSSAAVTACASCLCAVYLPAPVLPACPPPIPP
jgi:hypothetical protein